MQGNQQEVNDFQYLIHDDFLQSTYKQLENYDKPYISILWNGTSYPAYNLYIAKFLISESVEIYPVGSTIDGTSYTKSYVEGYISGKDEFERLWPSKVLLGEHAEAYINDLHRLCFHKPNQIFEGDGWLAAAQDIPYLINHTAIKYYGFFSGKLAGYNNLVHNYAALFDKLVKCDLSSTESKGEATSKLSVPSADDLGIKSNKTLFIKTSARQQLYDALKPHVEPDDKGEHTALSALILKGSPPEKPIIFNCLLKTFGLSFYTAKAVPDLGAKALSEQLPKYFQRDTGTEIVDLKPSILVKHLRGKQD